MHTHMASPFVLTPVYQVSVNGRTIEGCPCGPVLYFFDREKANAADGGMNIEPQCAIRIGDVWHILPTYAADIS